MYMYLSYLYYTGQLSKYKTWLKCDPWAKSVPSPAVDHSKISSNIHEGQQCYRLEGENDTQLTLSEYQQLQDDMKWFTDRIATDSWGRVLIKDISKPAPSGKTEVLEKVLPYWERRGWSSNGKEPEDDYQPRSEDVAESFCWFCFDDDHLKGWFIQQDDAPHNQVNRRLSFFLHRHQFMSSYTHIPREQFEFLDTLNCVKMII